MAVFDLPTQTKEQRRHYTDFRKLLLSKGFIMMQFSVYIRHVPTIRLANSLAASIGPCTPDGGKCSFILLTDKQYGMTKNYYGHYLDQKNIPKKQEQLMLFEDI